MGYFGVHLARRSLERTRIFHDTRGRNKSAVGSEKEGRIGGGVRRGGSKGGIQGDRRRPKGVASVVSVCVLFSCVDDELVE